MADINRYQYTAKRHKRFEAEWLRNSKPEDVYFRALPDPVRARRSLNFKDVLAEVVFERYQDWDGSWVENDAVIWIGMIVSERPGAGAQLLKLLRNASISYGVYMAGIPAPREPRNWNRGKFSVDELRLAGWLERQGFELVRRGSAFRVVFTPYCGVEPGKSFFEANGVPATGHWTQQRART